MKKRAKQRTAAEWAGLVRAWEASGESAREFTAQRKLALSTFWWWRSRLRRVAQVSAKGSEARKRERRSPSRRATGFAEIRVVSRAPEASVQGRVELRGASGWVVSVTGRVDPAVLEDVLRVASRC